MKRLSTFVIGTLAIGSTAFAANYTVTPAEGYQKQIENEVVITFDAAVTLGTGNPSVSYNVGAAKETLNCENGIELQAEGNNLKIHFTRGDNWTLKPNLAKPFKSMSGVGYNAIGDPCVMYFEVPAGAYNVGGVAGEALKINYTLATNIPEVSFKYTVAPEEGWPGASLANFVLTFEGNVEYVGTSANNNEVSVLYNGDKTYTSGMTVTTEGKTLTLKAKKTMAVGTSGCFGTVAPAIKEGEMIFTFPAGSYTVDGEAGPELKVTYFMAKEDPNASTKPQFNVTPAVDSHVASLPTVKINFGENFKPEWVTDNITAGTIEWSLNGNSGVYTNAGATNISTYTVEDNSLVITLPNGGLAPGKYTFYLNKNKYKVNGEAFEDKEFAIYVDEPAASSLQEFEYTADPDPSAVQSELKTITLTLPGTVQYAWPYKSGVMYSRESAEAAATSVNNWFANNWIFGGCYAEGNKLIVSNSASTGLSVDKANPWVYIYFRDGAFTVDGVPNKAFTLKYYLGDAPDYFYYNADPAEGKVTQLDKVTMNFYNIENLDVTATEGVKGQVYRNNTLVEDAEVTLDNLKVKNEEAFVDVNVTPAQTQPGQYQIVLPAGALAVGGLGSPEFKLNYSVDYATSEYTVIPADNTEMKRLYRVAVTFDDEVEVAAAPDADYVYLYLGGKAKMDASYSVENSTLFVELERPREAYINEENERVNEGETTFTIPAGMYTLNGVEGAELVFTYVLNADAPSVVVSSKYDPATPDPMEYFTCTVQTRTIRDMNGDRVLSLGDQGDVQVIGQRIATGDVYRPYGKISFTLSNTYDNGTKKIANNKMDFRILILRNGQTEAKAEPYIFDAEAGYLKWEQNDYEPMEWIKNGFTDAYDFGLSLGEGDGPNKYSICFYGVSDDIAKVGVQSRWERSEKIYESAIAWAEPTTPDLTGVLTWEEYVELRDYWAEHVYGDGIDEIISDAMNVEYFDLQGRRVLNPGNGLYIVKAISGDGSVKVFKVMR